MTSFTAEPRCKIHTARHRGEIDDHRANDGPTHGSIADVRESAPTRSRKLSCSSYSPMYVLLPRVLSTIRILSLGLQLCWLTLSVL